VRDIGLSAVPPVILDADAAAYITAVEAADTEPLETGVKLAINDFVLGCKDDGIWNAIKASCILAGARTLTGALVPLVGAAPTNNNFVSGDYNRKTGLTGNRINKYLALNRNNNVDPQNSRHFAIHANLDVPNNVFHGIFGCPFTVSGWTTYYLDRRSLSGYQVRLSSTGSAVPYAPINSASGFLGMNRSVSSSVTSRTGGVSDTVTTNVTSQAPSSDPLFLFTVDSNDVVTGAIGPISFYSIGESLDLALLDARVTRLVDELEFCINTGLEAGGYDTETLRYVNAGYAAGGTLS
jgi:hypothetical protein